MSIHIFGMLLTHEGTFSNNRGENEGNTNTLQKVIRNGDLYTTVSAESIRYALRDGWQRAQQTLNRRAVDHRSVRYEDREFQKWQSNIDDDVLGFMHASNDTVSRRAALEGDPRHFCDAVDGGSDAQFRFSRLQPGGGRG